MENPSRNPDQNVTGQSVNESRESQASAAEFGANLIDTPLMDELMRLCELEVDAVTVYSQAAERVEDQEYRAALLKFGADHERHLDDFTIVIIGFGGQPPMLEEEPKGFKTIGIASLAGLDTDHAILKAMMTNEVLTNELYDGILTSDLLANADPGLRQMLEEHRNDERRHFEWLEDVVLSLDRGGKVSISEQANPDLPGLEQNKEEQDQKPGSPNQQH